MSDYCLCASCPTHGADGFTKYNRNALYALDTVKENAKRLVKALKAEEATQAEFSVADKMRGLRIAVAMSNVGFSDEFVAEALSAGLRYQGFMALMVMWDETEDVEEAEEIRGDLCELLEDIRKPRALVGQLYMDILMVEQHQNQAEQDWEMGNGR